ncbi:unnamed protein product [Moneuplotes crassus]|uniref:Uncharacterized protein n=1 Tax=Euplotes crassus TaxID=5936 RepID=A0AAD1UQ01_EUPCR|nr:unnamed protein product [Moneuplotes crassus]
METITKIVLRLARIKPSRSPKAESRGKYHAKVRSKLDLYLSVLQEHYLSRTWSRASRDGITLSFFPNRF